MKRDEWWKNFALGIEVDVSGTFIYNGAKTLHDIPSLNNAVDIFEVLYGFSVGIERLLKVAIILTEHDDQVDVEEFEKSLLSHNTLELLNRLEQKHSLSIGPQQREFLALLSIFYKTHRYGRFTSSSVPDIKSERADFLRFISKYLDIQFDLDNEFMGIDNTDQIRAFIGRSVKKVSDEIYRVIQDEARRLNIYTYELRSDSKAIKVFYGEKLDFIDEESKKREILLFLMNPNQPSKHLEALKTFGVLDFDPAMAPNYIKALLNDLYLPYVGDEVDELYYQVEDVKDRLEMLKVLDSEWLAYDPDDELDD
jgi:hypothetical protein